MTSRQAEGTCNRRHGLGEAASRAWRICAGVGARRRAVPASRNQPPALPEGCAGVGLTFHGFDYPWFTKYTIHKPKASLKNSCFVNLWFTYTTKGKPRSKLAKTSLSRFPYMAGFTGLESIHSLARCLASGGTRRHSSFNRRHERPSKRSSTAT